jgi:leucyl aminopeptidase (aminopeptidase T)
MSDLWDTIAARAVSGVGVQAGDLVLIQEHAGHPAALAALLGAVEQAGATPLPEIAPPAYVARLLATTDPAHLATWDRHWSHWGAEAARAIVLTGGGLPDFGDVPPAALAAWSTAQERFNAVTEERRLPTLVMAVPTEAMAARCGLPLADLEAVVLPALAVPAATLQAGIARLLAWARGVRHLTLESGAGHVLRCRLGDRPWMSDDGVIDAADLAAGACVSNLPAGSIYTTVLEDSAEGTLALPQAGPAREVVFCFAAGRIVDIQAAEGGDKLAAWLDSHSGEPRRISHLGIACNPALAQPIGWTIVDEHVPGMGFLALGENRYMGGQNISSLNVDYTLPNLTVRVDDHLLVREGKLV